MEPGNSDIASLEREFDQASLDYIASKEKLDNERKNKVRKVSGNGELKLMVMGQPNAEPESLDPLTLVIVVVLATINSLNNHHTDFHLYPSPSQTHNPHTCNNQVGQVIIVCQADWEELG